MVFYSFFRVRLNFYSYLAMLNDSAVLERYLFEKSASNMSMYLKVIFFLSRFNFSKKK